MELLEQLLKEARLRQALPEPSLRRLVRERVGLSQGEIARVLGVSRAAVCRWESGRRHPRRVTAAEYAALLERLAKSPAHNEREPGGKPDSRNSTRGGDAGDVSGEG